MADEIERITARIVKSKKYFPKRLSTETIVAHAMYLMNLEGVYCFCIDDGEPDDRLIPIRPMVREGMDMMQKEFDKNKKKWAAMLKTLFPDDIKQPIVYTTDLLYVLANA